MEAMLRGTYAYELADRLAIDEIPVCPLCLSELAWEFHEGRTPSIELVARTVAWIWPEIKTQLEDVVVRARMLETPHAEEALRDLRERQWRSPLVAVVVRRLARQLAVEMYPSAG